MRVLYLILSIICPSVLFAQYYNPYLTPQQAQSAYNYGYQLGQQMAEQQRQQNQAAYNWGYGMGLVQNGQRLIAEGKYTEALEKFEEAYNEYNYITALEAMGLCYEVGIGTTRDTEWADILYNAGVEENNAACIAAVRRINSTGHYPASARSQIISNISAAYRAQTGGGVNITPTLPYSNSSSGSSTSSERQCPSCNGTGKCKTCNGQGWYYHETGYYTGRSGQTRTDCPVCRGTTNCGTCHGRGSIR